MRFRSTFVVLVASCLCASGLSAQTSSTDGRPALAARGRGPLPDLIVERVTFSPARPVKGSPVMVGAKVKNVGKGLSRDCRLRIAVAGADRLLIVPRLREGQVWSGGTAVTLRGVGVCTATAQVDATKMVREANEDNNGGSVRFRVSPPPRPDLLIEGITSTPARPKERQTVAISCRVKNAGSLASPACRLRLQVAGGKEAKTLPLAALEPGASTRVVRRTSLSRAKTYRILAKADVGETVAESNEKNNEAEANLTVARGARCDLGVEDVTVRPASPVAGRPAAVSCRVTNGGTAPSRACKLRMTFGGVLREFAVPALDPGKSFSQSLGTVIRTAGPQRAWAKVDPEGTVLEEDEGNNEGGLSFVVKAR